MKSPFLFVVLGLVCLAVVSTRASEGTDSTAIVATGYRLFEQNCAHCHGDDARGDEGPDLHGLRLSDARIQKTLKNGIKGEMPAFGKKFSDADVQALTAWLRTLKDKGRILTLPP